MTLSPCIVCGSPADGTRCPDHTNPYTPKAATTERGYDTAWRKLSERARRLQPFCLDCGTTEDLTTDHTPEAWARKEAGKPIRLCDVAVVCRADNAKRGQARPAPGQTAKPGDGNLASLRGEGAPGTHPDPQVKAEFRSDTPGGIVVGDGRTL